MLSKGHEYRAAATECAFHAQHMQDADCKRTLEQLAISWLKMAEKSEAIEVSAVTPCGLDTSNWY